MGPETYIPVFKLVSGHPSQSVISKGCLVSEESFGEDRCYTSRLISRTLVSTLPAVEEIRKSDAILDPSTVIGVHFYPFGFRVSSSHPTDFGVLFSDRRGP